MAHLSSIVVGTARQRADRTRPRQPPTAADAALNALPPQEAQHRLDALLAAYPAQAEAAARAYDIARAGPVESLVRILSDAGYVEPARHYARQHPAAWAYRFAYVPTKDRAHARGAHHGAELPYVFDTAGWYLTAEDRRAVDAVHGTWVRFIRTGDPGWPAHAADGEPINEFTRGGSVVGPDALRERLDVVAGAKRK
jgi:Carboxylesterase type B